MRQNQLLPAGETAVPPPPPPRLFGASRWWAFLAILVAVVGALAAATRLLTRFSFWDDEGYVLISLAHYVKEGHLYTQTFSQYGPFYFYAQGLFFQLLHLSVTHDSGRLVTLVYWTASSLLAAVFGYRLSRSVFLACACGLCIMLAGLELTNEPGHPEHVLLLLYMAAACLAQAPQSGHYRLRFVLLGCIGAALAFTKINVGVFYLAGLACRARARAGLPVAGGPDTHDRNRNDAALRDCRAVAADARQLCSRLSRILPVGDGRRRPPRPADEREL